MPKRLGLDKEGSLPPGVHLRAELGAVPDDVLARYAIMNAGNKLEGLADNIF